MIRARRRWLAACSVPIVASAAAWALIAWARGPSPIRSAERALGRGDLAGAGTILRRLLKERPGDARARLLQARLLRLSNRPRDADVALGRAMDAGAPPEELRREYALLIAGSRFREAERDLRAAWKAHPDDVEVLRALGDGLASRGDWTGAAEFYDRWLAVEPESPEALVARSNALIQDRRPAEAEAGLRAILDRRPDDFEARLLLANGFLSDAETSRAEPELLRCHRLRPDRVEPIVGLAGCALDRGDLDRARSLLDRALAIDPSSIAALTYRGNLELRRRESARALADFRRVVELDPGNIQGHLSLAQVLRRDGDLAGAKAHEQLYHALVREAIDRREGRGGMR